MGDKNCCKKDRATSDKVDRVSVSIEDKVDPQDSLVIKIRNSEGEIIKQQQH